MARREYRVNIFSPASIERLQSDLEKEAKEFDKKLETFLDRLADVAMQTAQSGFGGATTVTIQKGNGARKIIAAGTDEAYFVEFGTGVYAGTNNAQYLSVPSIVYPGSYSVTKGAHTWSAWLNAGNSEESYPYNSAPKSPMYHAYEAIKLNADRIAKEVFGA